MFALMRTRSTNLIDDLTTGLVNNMRFSDRTVLWPPDADVRSDAGVRPEWFYPSFKDANGTSELDTIHLYITQEAMYEELSELLLGIALVEMKHLDKLADLISDLGGTPARPNSTDKLKYGDTPTEAVRIAISGEQTAIRGYEELIDRISALPSNATTGFCLSTLAKLIADEQLHVALLQGWLAGAESPL